MQLSPNIKQYSSIKQYNKEITECHVSASVGMTYWPEIEITHLNLKLIRPLLPLHQTSTQEAETPKKRIN